MTTVLADLGYKYIPRLKIASPGLGGVSMPVNEDRSLKTRFQKLVRLGHSHRVCNRCPIWSKFRHHLGDDEFENLANLHGI